MSAFLDQLRSLQPEQGDRRWLYVPYDQLTDQLGPLAREPAEQLGLVLVESSWKAAQRPYHRQKLALILANQRHFALEQAKRGVAVEYLTSSKSYGDALAPVASEHGALRVMEPAERELRHDLRDLVEQGLLEVVPHEGWLTEENQFEACRTKAGDYRMDSFYRRIRQDTGILMKDGNPVGGKLSLDAENRKPWKGEPSPPEPLSFPVDPIKTEVGELVESRFADHPGELHLDRLPATFDDAEALWSWAKEHCFEHFGPFEDAMTTRSSGLFHTRVSALLNLHRLLPRRLVEEAATLDAPLSSREGFVRQILGWREFVRWIHRATDGFRRSAKEADNSGAFDLGDSGDPDSSNPARPSFLGADRALPAAYWGTASGLHCLDHVVGEVWREGYSHHINRLMILSNISTLIDVSPRELTDWFWEAYTDAFDWVVEPNVLGMGTFALGDLMTTKPYVSGSNYIHKMSDYCQSCDFDPRKDCPISSLYWQFLERHRSSLEDNPRMNLVMASSKRRSGEKKEHDRKVFEWTTDTLSRGKPLQPKDRPEQQ